MQKIGEIEPIFNLSNKNIELVQKIEKEILELKIRDDVKRDNLKIKSKVRSIHSSLAIEANSLSINEVSCIIDDKPVLCSRKEIQEVKNANMLYDNMSDFDWKKEDDFIRAHNILMMYFEDDNGTYRNHGEGIKKEDKIIFMAPDSFLVPSLMKSLFKYINDNKNKIHPLILASIFHYYFVFIHPFTDGNGRMARFWVTLMLKDYNSIFEYIPIEEEIYLNQDFYYNSISKCHINGNANEFIDFMLKIIYQSIIKTTQKTTQKVKLSERQLKIIELIQENPYITRKELASILNITDDGVKYNLNKLSKNNYLKRVGPDNGGFWEIID